MPIKEGQYIANRYRVDQFLGRGGMSEVYKVWDSVRSTHLAMKLLHEDLALDKIFLRRFQREAQTLSKLQHPNIVRFYGLEQQGRMAYLLMDFIDGHTLRDEIFEAKKAVPVERVLEVMRSVCSALKYAHNVGFVHCDIKPANIMIHKNGTICIADFGITRMSEGATATLVGAGTPAYMSPEQILGKDPTSQTDIYALGIVLYEMLTGGERPFTGENAQITGTTGEKVRWEQLRLDPPSPRKYNKAISPVVEAVVMKCLAKEPGDRYPDVMELYTSLNKALLATKPKNPKQQVGREPELPANEDVFPELKPKRRFPVWALIVFILLLLLIPAVYFIKLETDKAFLARQEATAETIRVTTLQSLNRMATQEAYQNSTATAQAITAQAVSAQETQQAEERLLALRNQPATNKIPSLGGNVSALYFFTRTGDTKKYGTSFDLVSWDSICTELHFSVPSTEHKVSLVFEYVFPDNSYIRRELNYELNEAWKSAFIYQCISTGGLHAGDYHVYIYDDDTKVRNGEFSVR